MKKALLNTNAIKYGFSLVEILLSAAIFSLFVTAFVGAYLYGQESTVLSGNRARALYIAEEAVESVRNIRDNSFDNLIDGTHGLTVQNNIWTLSGQNDSIDIFTREIIISSINQNKKSVVVNVAWQQNPQRTGLVSIETELTNWQEEVVE